MTPRAYVRSLAVLCAGAAGLGVPGAGMGATRSSGGGGLPSQAGVPAPGPQAQPGDVTVSATAGGITVSTSASGFLRRTLRFTGSVPGGDAGEPIDIQRSRGEAGRIWSTVAQATVQPGGSFEVLWRADRAGRFAVRAVLARGGAWWETGAAAPTVASTSSQWPTVTVTVYRRAIATLFGPGLYGRRTACGEVLRRRTIGVANRRLPCGTPVAVYYRGNTLVVPVIDRGPYANGADWDLTMATARVLGITSTVRIGAAALPRAAA